MSKSSEKREAVQKEAKVRKDLPLGGDYALDANDNPVVVYEDRTGKLKGKGK